MRTIFCFITIRVGLLGSFLTVIIRTVDIVVHVLLRSVVHGHKDADNHSQLRLFEELFAELVEGQSKLLMVHPEQLQGVGEGGGVGVEELQQVVSLDGGVGEGEDPGGQVSGQGGEAEVGHA